jgi:hypothetical protein
LRLIATGAAPRRAPEIQNPAEPSAGFFRATGGGSVAKLNDHPRRGDQCNGAVLANAAAEPQGRPPMTRSTIAGVSILALVIAAAPAMAGERTAEATRVARKTSSPPKLASEDCETRMQKLDASTAEGEERLAEKNAVIAVCDNQYKRDSAIGTLVKQCAKYEEQPVVKQQFVAECQLAAFNYANALRALKAEYRQ